MVNMTNAGAHDNRLSENLQKETRQLQNAWAHHDQASLNSYLVQGVEDPRINIQSILTRHFLLRELFGDRCDYVMEHEIRFALTANWLLAKLTSPMSAWQINNEMNDVLFALLDESNNSGKDVPVFLKDSFEKLYFPNYINDLLSYVPSVDAKSEMPDYLLNTFMQIWAEMLCSDQSERISVLEPACGSANEYRFFHRTKLSNYLDYRGFDLCEKNITNANRTYPDVEFCVDNVFDISVLDNAYMFGFVHDLFEHLSPEGFEKAIMEITRVTSHKVCLHFFNMADIPEHQIKHTGEYHWNTLSLAQIRKLIEPIADSVEIIHIDTWLRNDFCYPYTHNKEAYTWFIELRQ